MFRSRAIPQGTAAGVFEMTVLFMLAVFCGRMIRWLALSLLVLKLGPGAVGLVAHHGLILLAVVGGDDWLWLVVDAQEARWQAVSLRKLRSSRCFEKRTASAFATARTQESSLGDPVWLIGRYAEMRHPPTPTREVFPLGQSRL